MHVEAIWVRRIGEKVQVLFESLGKWRLVIEESADGSFSHIAEHPALEAAPEDDKAAALADEIWRVVKRASF
jgi:hypothetical protein